MRALFRPATALVGRLRYAQKFVAVGLILMLPLGFVAKAYVDVHTEQINLSMRERTGVAYLVPVIELTALVVEARHRAVDRGEHPEVDLAAGIARVDALDKRYGVTFETRSQWERIEELLGSAGEAETPRAAFETYNQATNGLLRLIVHVGDHANLTLDPQLDTYYLMNALQFHLPVMLDTSGRMVDQALLARRDLSINRTEVAIDLGLDNGVLASTRTEIAKGLGTAARSSDSPEIRRLAGEGFSAVYTATQMLVNQVKAATRTRRIQDVQPEGAAEIRVQVTTFAVSVAEELDRLLAERIAQLSRETLRIQAVSLVAALLAVYLFIGFYLSMSTPVRRMVAALRAVADGDLSARVRIETHDELSFVGRVLNETIARTQAAADRLAHQATHDPLTDLPNRTWVVERLGAALAHPGTGALAVLFLDLDRFKLVNDSMGHAAGDELLVTVARRLNSGVRPGDSVGRLAGDEFVVICEDLGDRDLAVRIAERLLAVLAPPIEARDHSRRPMKVTASVGIAFASDASVSPDDLLRDADVAMYQAKQRGPGRIEIFDERLRATIQQRLDTQEDLRQAIAEGELCLHYQPIVDVAAGTVIGLEALVRWRHPQRGMLAPHEFVAIAEDSGLIVPLGSWVLREACGQAARWRDADPLTVDLRVSVNLSAQQLADTALVPTVAHVLDDTGMDPDRLWLEITESTIMADPEAARTTLADLRRLGVHLAIDDFGTGYSSLAYLRRFPVEALKIDRSFVQEVGTSAENDAIVSLITSLASTLGLEVVAEGVESAAQVEALQRLGCDVVQGYLFGRPLPPEEAWKAILAVPQLTSPAR